VYTILLSVFDFLKGLETKTMVLEGSYLHLYILLDCILSILGENLVLSIRLKLFTPYLSPRTYIGSS